MDIVAQQEMSLRVVTAFQVGGIPKKLLKAVRELGRIVREKGKQIPPRLMDLLDEFGDETRKYKDKDRDLAHAEELIIRDPKRLEQALAMMSEEELRSLERQTLKSMGIAGYQS